MFAKIRGIFDLCKMFNKNIFIAINFPIKRTDIQDYTYLKLFFPIPISLFDFCITFCTNILTFFK